MKARWVAAIGAVALVLAGGMGFVFAQSNDGGSGQSFLSRVAEKLGIQTSQLEDAVRSARRDQIDQAVVNGDLTEEQAQRLRERLDQMPLDGDGFFFGGPHRGMHEGGLFGPLMGLRQSWDDLASFLGLTPAELRDQVAGGSSLAEIAQAQGKSRDELRQFIVNEAQTQLQQAVENGRLTQDKADSLLSKMQDHVDEMLDASMPHFGDGPHMGPHMNRGDDGTRFAPIGPGVRGL